MPERRSYARLLVVLVVAALDIALVAWAVTAHRSGAEDALRVGSQPAAPVPSASSPSSSPAVATKRALPVAVGHGAALRAVDPGSCLAGGASLMWSSDDGKHWRSVPSPAVLVLRVRLTGDHSAAVIGADRSCRLAQWTTRDSGATWQRGDAAGNWSLPPSLSASSVYTPSGSADSPCKSGAFAVDLVGISSSSAVLLCARGAVYRTSDSGAHWTKLADAPSGAVALGAVSTDRALVLVRGANSCEGFAAVSVSSGSTERRGCLQVAATAVGLALSSSTDGVVSVDGRSAITHDRGHSFS